MEAAFWGAEPALLFIARGVRSARAVMAGVGTDASGYHGPVEHEGRRPGRPVLPSIPHAQTCKPKVLAGIRRHDRFARSAAGLVEADSGQPMADQTAIDV